jgi:hypothetical protein
VAEDSSTIVDEENSSGNEEENIEVADYALDIGVLVTDAVREEELFQKIVTVYRALGEENIYDGSYTATYKKWALGDEDGPFVEGSLTEVCKQSYNAVTGEGYLFREISERGKMLAKIVKTGDTFYRYEKKQTSTGIEINGQTYSSMQSAWGKNPAGIAGACSIGDLQKLGVAVSLASYCEMHEAELEFAAVWPTVSIYENGEFVTLQVLIQDGYNMWGQTQLTIQGDAIYCIAISSGYRKGYSPDGAGVRTEERVWRVFDEEQFDMFASANSICA